MKRKISILLLIFLLLAGGGYLGFQGIKIEIKAQVAQILLERSWKKTLLTGKENRPWSRFDSVPIFRLIIPKYNVDQIVLKGTSGQNLAFAPSYHLESSLPGELGTVVISGHRDTHLIYLKNITLGDIIKIQDRNKHWHNYIVEDLFIIDVKKENIFLDPNNSRLLIVTCYPFDSILSGTPFRYIVSAKKFNT